MTTLCIEDTNILTNPPAWAVQTRGFSNPPLDPRAYPRPLPLLAVVSVAAGEPLSSVAVEQEPS